MVRRFSVQKVKTAGRQKSQGDDTRTRLLTGGRSPAGQLTQARWAALAPTVN